MSRLIWIYVVCKILLLSPVAVKELINVLPRLSNKETLSLPADVSKAAG